MKRVRAILWIPLVIASCSEGTRPSLPPSPPAIRLDSATLAARLAAAPIATEQISQYIRRIFQDRDGTLWFGTTSDGVARYDGRSLRYFTTADGLGNNWVSAIAQDAQGNLWFATGGGVSRFDGSAFTTYTTKDGLASDQVWCMVQDRSGAFWFGTEEGVSRFDGRTFSSFPIPQADLSRFPYYKYPKQINAMLQDKAGNIWFASNGGGVYRFDGRSLTNLSEKDGLCNNFVTTMLEDRSGNLWIGTHYGGLCVYDGHRSTRFTRDEGLKSDHIWTLYQDEAGLIWISAVSYGLCSLDPSTLKTGGGTFTCHTERDAPPLRNVQSILEDAQGQLWIGTSGGVYRYQGGTFTNWTKQDAQRPS